MDTETALLALAAALLALGYSETFWTKYVRHVDAAHEHGTGPLAVGYSLMLAASVAAVVNAAMPLFEELSPLMTLFNPALDWELIFSVTPFFG